MEIRAGREYQGLRGEVHRDHGRERVGRYGSVVNKNRTQNRARKTGTIISPDSHIDTAVARRAKRTIVIDGSVDGRHLAVQRAGVSLIPNSRTINERTPSKRHRTIVDVIGAGGRRGRAAADFEGLHPVKVRSAEDIRHRVPYIGTETVVPVAGTALAA